MNKNYIGVISKKENNDLCLKKVDISKDHIDLLAKLKDMCENPNRTLLDLQNEFVRTFTKKDYFYLCLPYSYSSSYIDGICYPECITFDEYQKKIEDKQKSLKDENLQRSDAYIEKCLSDYKELLKNNYYYKCVRFVDGYNFSKTSSMVKTQSSTVMISTEDIGWTSYEYKVNDDILISIHTNFGYGSSSYFFLNLKYKGIDILPYSSIVRYYKANIMELRRHTRQYSMIRDSWNVAFDFVVETANTAKNSPELFVRKWIVNELSEMMSSLKLISKRPGDVIDKFIRRKNDNIINGFCYNVRNIVDAEICDYRIYKNEMNLAFKAEKITGALLLLEKLQPLADLSTEIVDSISKIKRLNCDLYPDLSEGILKIQKDIDIHEQQRVNLEDMLKDLEDKAEPHNKRIDELQKNKLLHEKENILKNYMIENPEFDSLCSEIAKIKEKINNIKTHIRKREGFVCCLTECMQRLQIYAKVA